MAAIQYLQALHRTQWYMSATLNIKKANLGMDVKYGNVLCRLGDQSFKWLREKRKQEITTGNTCDTEWQPSLLMIIIVWIFSLQMGCTTWGLTTQNWFWVIYWMFPNSLQVPLRQNRKKIQVTIKYSSTLNKSILLYGMNSKRKR